DYGVWRPWSQVRIRKRSKAKTTAQRVTTAPSAMSAEETTVLVEPLLPGIPPCALTVAVWVGMGGLPCALTVAVCAGAALAWAVAVALCGSAAWAVEVALLAGGAGVGAVGVAAEPGANETAPAAVMMMACGVKMPGAGVVSALCPLAQK